VVGTQGLKVTRIGSLEGFGDLHSVCLRSNMLGSMRGVEGLASLESLELYENRIRDLRGLEGMTSECLAGRGSGME
jgi:hypothetical protein